MAKPAHCPNCKRKVYIRRIGKGRGIKPVKVRCGTHRSCFEKYLGQHIVVLFAMMEWNEFVRNVKEILKAEKNGINLTT